ncbi:MAG: V-type ATP synthase subunit I [Promethearchaeia archaeon]
MKEMISLFQVIINIRKKDQLLNILSTFDNIHIKEVAERSERQEDNIINEKINRVKNSLNMLFNRLKITEGELEELKLKKTNKIRFETKNIHEFLDYIVEETEFFVNRFKELDFYISKAQLELENKKDMLTAFQILKELNINRENFFNLKYLKFRVFTTFIKNLDLLQELFDFSSFPNVFEITRISNDRVLFFTLYLNEDEKKLKNNLELVHAEEIPILKKYLTSDGINFKRIENEIELIENNLDKYQKELDRIKREDLLKFAAMYEAILNIEKYIWAERQFEHFSAEKVSLKFFSPTEQKEKIISKLKREFNNSINIKTIDISKHPKQSKKIKETKEKELKRETTEDLFIKADYDESETQEELREEVPTLMHHNRFVRPFETLTKMYGTPTYSEIDPTTFLFFTFPLMFGLMFGDIGHGMVLIISGLIGTRLYKKKGGDIYNFCWIIMYCGIWAIIVGFLYGEFFGMEEIFGIPLEPITIPILNITLYSPLNNIITIIILTLAIGIIHINIGWVLQIINYWKSKKKYMAFMDSMVKIAFLDGGVALIVLYGLDINKWVMAPYPIFMVVIPGILLMISKPLGKLLGISYLKIESFGELFSEGSIEVFEAFIAVPSNVLSYIRILALALAHISLMVAIEAMIGLIPQSPDNIIIYILIEIIKIIGLIIGNAVVIALEGIIVFLQTLRLHYYEFFFKFYKGLGTEFTPFLLRKDFSEIIFKDEERKDEIIEKIDKEIISEEDLREINKAIDYISNKYLK